MLATAAAIRCTVVLWPAAVRAAAAAPACAGAFDPSGERRDPEPVNPAAPEPGEPRRPT